MEGNLFSRASAFDSDLALERHRVSTYVEGVDYKNIPAFSVQFRPGAAGGPSATDFLYDRFIDMMA